MPQRQADFLTFLLRLVDRLADVPAVFVRDAVVLLADDAEEAEAGGWARAGAASFSVEAMRSPL